jgi:hypothetical protein
MKILDIPQSGKSGTSVSVQGRYGQFRRKLVVPKDPRTNNQVRVRSAMSRFSAWWNRLTDDERRLWNGRGSETHSEPRLGRSGRLTGQQFFVKVNCILASIGKPMVTTPPERPQFPANPCGALTISNTNGAIALQLGISTTPATNLIVRGAAPCSQGVSFVWDFTILGLLPDGSAVAREITDMYVKKYGIPRAGSRVFIRTNQEIDGWEDAFVQTTAVVPSC